MSNRKVVVIDGQGGRLGCLIIEQIRALKVPCSLIAVGTNSIATAAMLRSGAEAGATGENPVVVACRDADFIIGPVGIVCADALLGEITPAMAEAVGRSGAQKLLVPVNMCSTRVVGVQSLSFSALAQQTAAELKSALESIDG